MKKRFTKTKMLIVALLAAFLFAGTACIYHGHGGGGHGGPHAPAPHHGGPHR